MAKSNSGSTTGRWRSRLTHTLAGEPRDRAQLIEMLARGAASAALLDADAFAMLEGVLEVADLQVRDIMVPRAQMVCRAARRAGRAHSVGRWSSRGHSRFPVLDDDRDDVVGILLAKDLLRLYAGAAREQLRHARIHAPGGVRAGVQAAQRAAQGISPQPQSHGDRGR